MRSGDAKITPAAVRWIRKQLRAIARGEVRGKEARATARDVDVVVRYAVQGPGDPAQPPPQFALRVQVFDPATGRILPSIPPTGTVFETDYFQCEHFGRCIFEVRHCLERQGARWPGGNRKKDGTIVEKKAGVHPHCASGVCEQGKDLAARCEWRPELVWSKGRYRFFRDDTPEQRRAMKAYDAEHLPVDRQQLTPFQEVAAMTKDDPVVGKGG